MSTATATKSAGSVERYRAAFDACCTADALADYRRQAFDQFAARGFPSPRDEAWKYTNLRRLESRAFTPAQTAPVAIEAGSAPWIEHCGSRIVFVNGHWAPALSSIAPYPPGVTALTFGEWLKHEPAEALAYMSRTQHREASAFEHLNAAFFQDGVVIDLASDAQLDAPIQVVHLWSSHAQLAMSHPRLLVRAGRNSRCTIVEQFLSMGEAETFTNAVATLELDAGAIVEHYRLQEESTRSFHIGHTNIAVRQHARYALHDVSLGSALSRVNITTLLEQSGAHVALRGLFAPNDSQHMDVHTRIEHIATHTTSDEDYRGIASGRGRGVFNGKVLVHADAQKTDARQSSRNLLLSQGAEIDAKPELEIYADDVKCSHGATVGQLDPAALFYLRSRGVSELDARALLIRAFAESILSSVRDERVRKYLESRLAERFGTARAPS